LLLLARLLLARLLRLLLRLLLLARLLLLVLPMRTDARLQVVNRRGQRDAAGDSWTRERQHRPPPARDDQSLAQLRQQRHAEYRLALAHARVQRSQEVRKVEEEHEPAPQSFEPLSCARTAGLM
jgi:hypothetical protein